MPWPRQALTVMRMMKEGIKNLEDQNLEIKNWLFPKETGQKW